MTPARRAVITHAHLYQPPREDPWLGEVPHEASAAPFANWNARIERECYRPLTAARVLDADANILRVLNAFEFLSFDVGATLLSWLEREAPDTYASMVAADQTSCDRHSGHGNAIASPYHHVILPLCSLRDKKTEVRWGIEDFTRRFGRDPEGLWLPETAVDEETLDVVADAGIRFTILAPHQVTGAPADGTPGRYRTASGKELGIFVYDGGLAHDVAFGPLSHDATAWEQRLYTDHAKTLSMTAVDGETFGHHHDDSDLVLATLIDRLLSRTDAYLTNPAAWLAANPPTQDVTLVAPSSWSCSHGVDRWRAACGCRAYPEETSQAWREPLRTALDWLAHEAHRHFEIALTPLASDPFAVRDAYGEVVARGPDAAEDFSTKTFGELDHDRRTDVLELLEMERSALSMFTSCGWFFDDVAGLESRLILRYAAHVVERSGPNRESVEAELLERLVHARSNDEAVGTARDIYLAERRTTDDSAMLAAAVWHAAATVGRSGREALPTAYDVSGTDEALVVERRATGRRWNVTATATRSNANLTIHITAQGHARTSFALSDFPDRARAIVVGAMREEIARSHFTEAERWNLASGTPATDVAGRALEQAIFQLDAATEATGNGRVDALLDYLALLDAPIPFDAQTAFATVRDRLSDAVATRLAHRLRFR